MHSRDSGDPAIVFVVSVTLEKVSKIIQIHSIHAEKCHLVDRMRTFSAAAYESVEPVLTAVRTSSALSPASTSDLCQGRRWCDPHGKMLIRTTK